jgi:hypothetical protein
VTDVAGNSGREAQPQTEPRPEATTPGQFVSDEHRSDCRRFLEEVKNVVRHRCEAGLARERSVA